MSGALRVWLRLRGIRFPTSTKPSNWGAAVVSSHRGSAWPYVLPDMPRSAATIAQREVPKLEVLYVIMFTSPLPHLPQQGREGKGRAAVSENAGTVGKNWHRIPPTHTRASKTPFPAQFV